MVITFNNLGGGGGSYVLPVATDSVLGGIKVGSGLTITNDGVLSSEGNDENIQHVYSAATDTDMWEMFDQLKQGDVVYIPKHNEDIEVEDYLYEAMADNDCGLLDALENFDDIGRDTIRRIVLKLQENENYDPETVEDINDKAVFVVNSNYYYGFWFKEGSYYYLSGATQIDYNDISYWTLIDSSDVEGFEVVINIDENGWVGEHSPADSTHFYPYNNTYTSCYCDVGITHSIDLKTYQLSVDTFIGLNGLENSVSELEDELYVITESIGQNYTPTSGFTTINGSAITEGGNIEIQGGGDSTALEEITELPENPVDGAVYNYNGVLIKYVNGAGNWGHWTGENSVKNYGRGCNGSLTLFYAVLPSDMDGELVFGVTNTKSSSADTDIKAWGYMDLQNSVINVYDNKDKTGSTIATITKNASSETVFVFGGFYNCYASWKDNCIQIRPDGGSVQVLRYCSTSASTAHYELVEIPDYNYPITRDTLSGGIGGDNYLNIYACIFENDGTVRPGLPLYKRNQKINGTYYHPAITQNELMPNLYAPTASGTTGTLCVSQGDTAPQWKTVVQALGVDFWTGTQAEYDAIVTKSATTLYIIIPE